MFWPVARFSAAPLAARRPEASFREPTPRANAPVVRPDDASSRDGTVRSRRIFLVVEARPDETAPIDDTYLYSNLADPAFQSDLGYIATKCAELGVRLPAELLADLAADCAANVGNLRVDYGTMD